METQGPSSSEDAVGASQTRISARLGSRFGSPLTLAIAVVVLVSSVGLVATGSAYWLLREAGRDRAESWLRMRSEQLKDSLGQALGIADPLLDQLAIEVRRRPSSQALEPLLHTLYALGTAHAGLAWVSVSFPDGTFIGVYRTEDGQLRAQESRIGPSGGIERRFSRDARGTPQETSRRATDYDPRKREFYRLALSKRRRAWTAPYPFLQTLRTGVTRVEPTSNPSSPPKPKVRATDSALPRSTTW